MCMLCATVLSCSHSRNDEEPHEREPNMVDVVLRFDFADQPHNAAPAVSKSVADDMLKLSVGNLAASTKANATNIEREIHNLNIFFIRERYASGVEANTVKHIYLNKADLTINADSTNGDVVIKDIYLGKYIMYMIANVGDLSQNGTITFTPRQLNDFKFGLPDINSTSAAWALSGLPMYGKENVEIKFLGDAILPISGKLNFAVSKVNFNCKINQAFTGYEKIYISSVSLMNFAAHYNPFNTTAPKVTQYRDNYSVKYTPTENKKSVAGYFYAYPNSKGDIESIDAPEERNISNAPSGATYLYVETTYTNKSNNTENYGFYIYLGKESKLSNFDTDIGKLYNINVNIEGIDPGSDSRISSLIITIDHSDTAGAGMRKDSLCTYPFTIKAHNLKGQYVNLTMRAEPAPKYNKKGYVTMMVLTVDRKTVLNGPVTHFDQLVVVPFLKVDANNYEQTQRFGFIQHHDVLVANSGNYIVIDVEIENGVKSSVMSAQLWTKPYTFTSKP